ncbi:4'-phosphopantetheinyl transferase [Phyllobacterium endophyticum]|uniref:Phosphopantetheinyl transferase n=2 Tax=Phyllobacterium endophyticum TaxID=1149773 RepID=A0A2P7AZW4_9HYPH|nr:4'-phosphopantetheinyl transferase [Phyllobacterium endophyticum]PSH59741.1 phosphopantetheinyl transferase [Phyllobacterium endophyticum]TYR41888.1 4'-phosphopantetheinyl transferase superfamily protein [Phyllobacterium endophyticum]
MAMRPFVSIGELPAASPSGSDDPCVDIWWWAFDPNGDWRALAVFLTAEERKRAAEFRFEKDALAFAAGRYLQRRSLSVHLGLAIDDLHIVAGQHGKPFLAGHENEISFNLTNTHGLVAFAISRSATSLGIDAEPLKTPIEPEASLMFCSAAERQVVAASKEAERASLLVAYWTIKESFLKAMGTGLLVDPAELTVQLEDGSIRIDRALSEDEAWHHRLLVTPSGHSIAVSARSPARKLLFRQFEFSGQ